MNKVKACVRCGRLPLSAMPNDGGWKVRCVCGQLVWSSGRKSEAVAEWNNANAATPKEDGR